MDDVRRCTSMCIPLALHTAQLTITSTKFSRPNETYERLSELNVNNSTHTLNDRHVTSRKTPAPGAIFRRAQLHDWQLAVRPTHWASANTHYTARWTSGTAYICCTTADKSLRRRTAALLKVTRFVNGRIHYTLTSSHYARAKRKRESWKKTSDIRPNKAGMLVLSQALVIVKTYVSKSFS